MFCRKCGYELPNDALLLKVRRKDSNFTIPTKNADFY